MASGPEGGGPDEPLRRLGFAVAFFVTALALLVIAIVLGLFH